MNFRTGRCLKILPTAFILLFSSLFLSPMMAVSANQVVISAQTVTDSSGNTLTVGGTVGFGRGPSVSLLMKYGPSGKLLCVKTWGGPQDTYGYGVASDSSNNIYVTGATQSFGGQQPDVFLLKYDSSCNLLFQIPWGGAGNDVGRGVAVDEYDNVYVTGNTDSYNASRPSVFLLKYDPAGEMQFARIWGSNYSSVMATGIATDGAGHIYITGTVYDYRVQQTDVFLLRYDSSGNLQFHTTWGGTQSDYGTGIVVDGVGNVYVTGYTFSPPATPGFASVILLKFDPLGNLLFQKTWGGTRSDYGSAIAADAAGSVYVTGYSYSLGEGQPVVFLLKYDSSGNLLLQTRWGGAKGNFGYGVAVDGSGNAYVSGYTYSFGANSQGANLFILKYDTSGDLLFQKLYGGGVPGS